MLAGVDIGTTHLKVGFFTADGDCTAMVGQPTPADVPALVAAVRQALDSCTERTGHRPEAIGVAGMAETGVPLDARGQAITPLISWTDPRGIVPEGDFYPRTGRWAAAKAPLAKWLWLRAHEPAVLRRMRWWAGACDVVAHGLTGRLRTHETLAVRTLAYDVVRRDYDPELLALAGFEPRHLPRTAASVEPVGTWNGVPVVIAGHDHAVGAWASGVREPGQVADSLGTAEAVLVPVTHRPLAGTPGVTADPSPDGTGTPGVTADPSLDGTGTTLVAALPTSGAVLDWLLGLLTGQTGDGYAALPGWLAGVALPTGVVVEPYLRGRAAPSPDPARRMRIEGLGIDHGPGDLLAAAVEGTCLHVRWMIDELAEPQRLVVFGGQSRIPLWMRIKAALSPAPVDVVRSPDAVCAGAALVAGQAGGSLRDVPVLAQDRQPRDDKLAQAYGPVYERFRKGTG